MSSPTRRIVTIDCQYLHPEFAAAYLLIDGDQAAFIDNNTAHSVPLLLDALKANHLSPEQVQHVIITHVHLDHAGGTSQLMKACPKATLLTHPRASRHMIDPSKLIASAKQVYGEEPFARMYGLIEPIDASRVRTVSDDGQIPFGKSLKPLQFLHTRGHANHHFCVYDEETRSIFTGDAFGLCYPAVQKDGLFIFPSTSPTDFDYEEAVKSVDRIAACGAELAYPTHYGAVGNLNDAAVQLKEHLLFSHELVLRAAKSGLDDEELNSFCERELIVHFSPILKRFGKELLALDLKLNAQGLAFVAQRSRKSA